VAIESLDGDEAKLWVFGGRGGDNSFRGGPEVYFNDIWTAPIATGGQVVKPEVWTLVRAPIRHGEGTVTFSVDPSAMPWSPRTGHAVAFERLSANGVNQRSLYLSGGYNNGTFLEDVWVWRIDDPDEFWRKDFTPDALYSMRTGAKRTFANHSPSIYYLTPESDLSFLQRYWVPEKFTSIAGETLQKRDYLTSDIARLMNSVGIYTARDLADIDLYTLLKLHGFDFPQVPLEARIHIDNVCDFRALAQEVVSRCSINVPSLFDGEKNMPWNNKPVFGGPPPTTDNVRSFLCIAHVHANMIFE
jgi:hypothetical protein